MNRGFRTTAMVKHTPHQDVAPRDNPRLIYWVVIALTLLLLLLTAAWRWTKLQDWLDLAVLARAMTSIEDRTVALLVVIFGYTVLSLAAAPVTVLIGATVLAFGALQGFFYALAGTLVSAAVTYAIGQLFGKDLVRRFANSRIDNLNRRLARRGILTVAIVRMVPIAPFTLINVIAGASHIRFRDFMAGTVLGMIPVILAIALFIDRIVATLTSPTPGRIAVLGAVIIALSVVVWGLRKWLARLMTNNRSSTPEAPP